MRSPQFARDRLRRGVRAPTPAAGIAFLALLGCGAAPAAWAAGLLTGDDVRNGSLTGQDIKDGSIGPSDISRAGRTALKGSAGPTGATGPAGATGGAGATGATGPAGAAGGAGEAGPAGPTGAIGKTGLQGPPGPKGDPGATSDGIWASIGADGAIASSSPVQPTVVAVGSGNGIVYKLAYSAGIQDCAVMVSRQSRYASPADDATPIAELDHDYGGSAYTYFGSASGQIMVRLLTPGGVGTAAAFAIALHCPADVVRALEASYPR